MAWAGVTGRQNQKQQLCKPPGENYCSILSFLIFHFNFSRIIEVIGARIAHFWERIASSAIDSFSAEPSIGVNGMSVVDGTGMRGLW